MWNVLRVHAVWLGCATLIVQGCAPLTSPKTSLGPDGRPLSCSDFEHIYASAQIGDDPLLQREVGAAMAVPAARFKPRSLTTSTTKAVADVRSEGNAPSPDFPRDENILVLSGGGEWGAYGAGFINGLYGVDPNRTRDEISLRDFTRITGISTGAIMTPYTWAAIVHDRQKPDDPANPWLDKLRQIYTLPDDALFRKPFWKYGYLVFSNAIYDPRGLLTAKVEAGAREVWDVVRRDDQTQVSVGSSNAYDGQFRAFDLVDMVRSNSQSALPCFRESILASAAIPLAFPPRFIDGQPYYDGGIQFLAYLDSVFDSIAASAQRTPGTKRQVNIRLIVNGNQSPNDPGEDVQSAVACDGVKVGHEPKCAPVANSLLGITGGGKGLAFRVTQDIMLYQLKKDSVYRIYNDWLNMIETSNGLIGGTFKFTYISNAQLNNPSTVGAGPKPCMKTTSTQEFDLAFEKCLYDIGYAKGSHSNWDAQRP